MRRVLIYLLGALILFAVVLGAGEVSLKSGSCMACHQQQGQYAHWMGNKLVADKRGFSHELIACANCHIKGSPQGSLMSRFRGLGHVIENLAPQIDPRQPQVSNLFTRTRIPSENCQFCHLGAIKRKAVMLKDLPENLKKIGLVMDHSKHVFARNDQCAKCHERYKEHDPFTADKNVTYTEVNHMACDSCHTMASHAYKRNERTPMSHAQFIEAKDQSWKWLSTNPRWMVAMPSEASCRRCHNGQIHFKTRIFLADCQNGTDYNNCVKCHPLMTKEFFDNYRKQRQQTALNSGNSAGGFNIAAHPRNSRATLITLWQQ